MAEQEKNTPAQSKAKKPSIFARIGKWFRELKSECKKIVWPTRSQTLNNAAVVLACCIVVGIFIWILDAVFQFGIRSLLSFF